MAETSPENKNWIEYVQKNYSPEELKKQYEAIGEDGFSHTYRKSESGQ